MLGHHAFGEMPKTRRNEKRIKGEVEFALLLGEKRRGGDGGEHNSQFMES